ncbi:MAG: hypothetical protein WEA10_03660 [Actinomycetota bacterium]
MRTRRRHVGVVFLTVVLAAGVLAAAPVRAGGAAIGFGKGLLSLERSERPTSLQFGPDGRLYVAQLDGKIYAYAIVRDGPNTYRVGATETISAVRSIPNHDDDGTLNPSVTGRFVTGMLVVGTAVRPVLYVTSSDPRIGNSETGDTGLDTNSGSLSRLAWTGTRWRHRVLVVGLPRSEEVHATNGLAVDAASDTLYIAQGGHTNMGAPSASFNFLPEYALSGAILSVDLVAVGNGPYELPTLNDRSRPGSPDANDPFGGNDGRNQAKIVPGGPVQVYSPGFRNPYDVLLASNGLLYATDNGPNAGAGGLPAGEGPGGVCTDEPQEPGETAFDSLHLVEGPDDYNGAPNPTRGNTENTWGNRSPVAAVGANPVECDFLDSGPARGSLATFPESTNGIAEYTASNFEGAMQGDLLLVTLLDNLVSRVQLSTDGSTASSVDTLFSGVAKRPLDVTTQPDSGPFPGTIWVADHPSGKIAVFEPNDYDGTPPPCTGLHDPALDEDGDGYDNADELANGTDPCSAADVPPDADGDLTSDGADPDDDNDGLGDEVDAFAVDPDDGRSSTLPLRLTWDAGDPSPGGLLDSGFTGLMSDGVRDYADRFDPSAMTVGSATGSLTIDAAGEGTSHGPANTQDFGFQAGIDIGPTSGTFRLRGRVVAPFGDQAPEPGQAVGIVLGTGGQDDYVELSLTADGVSFLRERNGTIGARRSTPFVLPGPEAVDLILEVDPAASTVQPRYASVNAGAAGPAIALGPPVSVPAGWIAATAGLAVGVTATSEGPAPTFPAVWDSLKATSLVGGAP